MELHTSLTNLPGIGAKLGQAFAAKGITTPEELLLYLPRKYDDYSLVSDIGHLRPGLVTIKAKLSNVNLRRLRRGLSLTSAIASDTSGSVQVIWFNQPYRKDSLKAGSEYFLSGEFKLAHGQFSIQNPSVVAVEVDTAQSARIVPTYPESKSLSSWQVRKALKATLALNPKLVDPLPPYLIKQFDLMRLNQAIKQIHFPDNQAKLDQAKRRFQFDELFPLILANELATLERKAQSALVVPFKAELARQFVARLPFKLTNDQRRIIWQIYQDMGHELPMNRLVEGDVGSGKTVVAVMASVMAMSAGYKVAFMAPTELLARQHYQTISELLRPLGMEQSLVLLTGGLSPSEKRRAIHQANRLGAGFIVGTHSLLTSGVDWHNLVLLIIDEQHRFGVDQRHQLQRKAGHLPHFLSITATPIPRSLALTIFNDLDLSRLAQMPLGRKPITTKLIYPTETNSYFQALKREIQAGRQAYIVCPTIKAGKATHAVSAEKVFAEYRQKLSAFKIGLIHGQMKADEQTKVMTDFANGEIDVLVATTVIEVGVDVPNASVMAIYGPEHFGLAQLHQLRGRVGRGEYGSYCFLLLADSLAPPGRLRDFASVSDGFRLSELDLALRGPGAIYGKLQHGKGFSNLLTLDDQALVEAVKSAAKIFIERGDKLLKYPLLNERVAVARQITYLN